MKRINTLFELKKNFHIKIPYIKTCTQLHILVKSLKRKKMCRKKLNKCVKRAGTCNRRAYCPNRISDQSID